jgi:hypothetical protein
MLKSRASLFVVLVLVFAGRPPTPVLADFVIFEDDFEGDPLGAEPGKWTYDPTSEIKNVGLVDLDPLDAENQVFTGYGGYWADNGTDFSDFIAEWDWMFAQDNARNNSMGIRVQGPAAHYQLSRRGFGTDWKIYMFDGAWNEIGTAVFPTDVDKWYRVQLTAMGEQFVVKVKEKGDATPFEDLKPVLEVLDGTFGSGKFSTSYWGPIDNVVISKPDLVVERILPDAYGGGETFPVTLDLTTLAAFTRATVRERIPRFWTASDPSPPGRVEVDAAGRQTLIWEITGGVADQSFDYLLTAPNPYANVAFVGSGVEADGRTFNITGDSRIKGGTDGFLREGLLITLLQPTTGCAGSDQGEGAQARDYLTDGDAVTEATVTPTQGESVSPDFLGASPSPGSAGIGSLVWTRTAGPVFQLGACDDCMSYLAFYVENTTAGVLKASVGSASDDGEQILIDGQEVWNHGITRGNALAQVQDRTPLLDLAPGKHLVLQKVFDGCVGFDSAIRFEDEDHNPLTGPLPGGPLVFSLDPTGFEVAPAFVLRDLPDSLQVGETGKVTLKLRLRGAVSDALIEEEVPAPFAITEISDGGVRAGQKITWTIGGPLAARDLGYRISIPEGSLDASFAGKATLGGESGPILGDRAFDRGVMTPAGFIKQWLMLGPLETFALWQGDPFDPVVDPNSASAAPENGDLRVDYLSDGTLTEKTIRPFDGMRIDPRFNGDGIMSSRATGLEPITRACAPVTPTWERFVSRSGTCLDDEYFGGPIDSHATYAACYLNNLTALPITATVGIDSDDAFIAYLDGAEIVAYEPDPCSATACGRGLGAEDTVANSVLVTLAPGEHFLLTRVHDGTGASGHRLRFQDEQGKPLLNDRLLVTLKSAKSPPEVYLKRILSSASYRMGGDPLTVTLRVESTGAHQVSIREVLPPGFGARNISHGGTAAGGQATWNLAVSAGTTEVTYQLAPEECAGRGSYCGNGTDGSEYTVDGGKTHSLNGHDTFRRDTSGTDPLGTWDVRDLGYSGGGTQRVGDHAADATGKGAGVRGSRDEFRFISRPASGDFEVSAQIACLEDAGGAGQGGLMVRDTFDTFSAHAYFYLGPAAAGGGAATLKGAFRRDTNKTRPSTLIPISEKDVAKLPVWIKIKRTDLKISFQRSNDGVTFTEVGSKEIGPATSQVNLRTETLTGLAVSGGGAGSMLVAYREVSGPSFTEEVPAGPTFRRGDADVNGEIDLTDAITVLNFLFVGGKKPECVDASDFDDSGEVDISDAINNLNYQFLGGAAPSAPGPLNCGPDADQEPAQGKAELGCDRGCV